MKNIILGLFVLFVLFSCQKDYKIASLEIGDQRHVIGEHYDSEMTLCLTEEIGSSGFSFTLYVKTKDGRSFECSKNVYINAASDTKSSDKCVEFTTRPFFNVRNASKDDFANMKSMKRGNIRSIRVVIWDDSFKKIITEKTIINL
jgi:hypothetical protein